jgi:hypothetical protein
MNAIEVARSHAVRAPAILAVAPAPKTSARYGFVSTREVIELMGKEGWQVAAATQVQPRQRGQAINPSKRHFVDFRRAEDEKLAAARLGTMPRILFSNSHDATSSATMMMGMYRFVCSNGLVVGTSLVEQTTRHTEDAAMFVIAQAQALARQTTTIYADIERWARTDLTAAARMEFARMAAHLRWGHPDLYPAEDLLGVRRAEDDSGDLWSVFNRVQENCVRGGIQGLARSGRRATSRPLSCPARDVEFNRQLWELASEFAE